MPAGINGLKAHRVRFAVTALTTWSCSANGIFAICLIRIRDTLTRFARTFLCATMRVPREIQSAACFPCQSWAESTINTFAIEFSTRTTANNRNYRDLFRGGASITWSAQPSKQIVMSGLIGPENPRKDERFVAGRQNDLPRTPHQACQKLANGVAPRIMPLPGRVSSRRREF